jgi:hypothetical protein
MISFCPMWYREFYGLSGEHLVAEVNQLVAGR